MILPLSFNMFKCKGSLDIDTNHAMTQMNYVELEL